MDLLDLGQVKQSSYYFLLMLRETFELVSSSLILQQTYFNLSS